jgi:hypothetical protein
MLQNCIDVTHISLLNTMDKGLMTHLRLHFCGMQVYMNTSWHADCTISHNTSDVNDMPNLQIIMK